MNALVRSTMVEEGEGSHELGRSFLLQPGPLPPSHGVMRVLPTCAQFVFCDNSGGARHAVVVAQQ